MEPVPRDDAACEAQLREQARTSKLHPEYLMLKWHTAEWAVEEIDRLRTEVARLTDTLAAVMGDEWRDAGGELPQIDPETCRSRDVLGCWPQGGMMVVYYDVCKGWIDSEGGEECINNPTHWMPLPDAPVYQTAEQQWKLTCKSCGAEERWQAKSFFDAADSLPSGWSYDRALDGPVCPKCKV